MKTRVSATESSNKEDLEALALFDKNIQQLMQMGFSEVRIRFVRKYCKIQTKVLHLWCMWFVELPSSNQNLLNRLVKVSWHLQLVIFPPSDTEECIPFSKIPEWRCHLKTGTWRQPSSVCSVDPSSTLISLTWFAYDYRLRASTWCDAVMVCTTQRRYILGILKCWYQYLTRLAPWHFWTVIVVS